MPDIPKGRPVDPSAPAPPPTRRRAPDAALLDELRRVAALVDPHRPLTMRAFEAHSPMSACTIRKRLRGWQAALTAAGLSARDAGIVVTGKSRAHAARHLGDDALLDLLRRVARRDGVVTIEDVRRDAPVGWTTYRRRFGSWAEAVRRAGLRQSDKAYADRPLPPPPPRRPRNPASGAPGATAAPSLVRSKRPPDPEERKVRVRLRYRVMLRDDFRCALCGDSPALTRGCVLEIDHVVPWSRGGRTTLENLRTLCRPCNRGKGARLEERGMEQRGEPEEKP